MDVKNSVPMKDPINVLEEWDKGNHTYDPPGYKLLELKDGEKLGDVLSNCTICPIHNGSCYHFYEIGIYGFHPDKRAKITKRQICVLGVEGDGEKCPLNK